MSSGRKYFKVRYEYPWVREYDKTEKLMKFIKAHVNKTNKIMHQPYENMLVRLLLQDTENDRMEDFYSGYWTKEGFYERVEEDITNYFREYL